MEDILRRQLTATCRLRVAGFAAAERAALLQDRSPFEVTLERATDYKGLDDLDPDGTAWLRRTFPEFRHPIVLLPSAGVVGVLGLRVGEEVELALLEAEQADVRGGARGEGAQLVCAANARGGGSRDTTDDLGQ